MEDVWGLWGEEVRKDGYWWTSHGSSALLKAAKDFDTWQLDLPGPDKNYFQNIMHHYDWKIGQITRLLW